MSIPVYRRNGRNDKAAQPENPIKSGNGVSLRIPGGLSGMSLLQAALAYAECGWFVLPVKPGTKNPGSLVGKRWPELSSRDTETICQWWGTWPTAGIALHTGRSGAIVFDLDKGELADLPPDMAKALRRAMVQKTRSGRTDRGHYVFAVAEGERWGNSAGAFARYGDVRGANGVIIAQPTPHPADDGQYSWPAPGAVPPLPGALRVCLRAPGEKASRTAGAELLDELPDGAMSPAVLAALAAAIQNLDGTAGNRHDLVRDDIAILIRLGEGREPGVPAALELLKAAFVSAVSPDRTGGPRTAAEEFASLVAGGGRLIAADRVPQVAVDALRPGGLWHPDTPYPGQNREDLRARGLIDDDGNAVEREAPALFAPVSAVALAEPVPPMEWLIRGVWPRNSFGPMGGEKKTLKTYNLLALSIAVASGKPMFDEFEVVSPGPVLYYVGEGGMRPFQRRLQAVTRAYGVNLRDLDKQLYAVFQVGSLSSDAFTDALRRNLDTLQPALVVVDPLYAFHPPGIEAQNLYERGRMLAELSGLVADEAALVVADHFKKHGAAGTGGLDLDSISQAGMGQWADSWILQRHRTAPDLDAGAYRLEVEFGSRQWGGARYEIDWTLPALGGLESGEATAPELSWTVRRADGGSRRNNTDERLEERLRALAREQPFELTKTAFAAAVGGNRNRALATLDRLLASGRLEVRRVPRAEGTSGKTATRDRIGPSEHGQKVRLNVPDLEG